MRSFHIFKPRASLLPGQTDRLPGVRGFACNQGSVPLSVRMHAPARTESAPAPLHWRDTISHTSDAHAACGISEVMPNPGLRRMLAPWQRPELFLGEVLRHSLARAEDRNTELASIRFAQAYLAVTFVIDFKTRLARQLLGDAEETRQRTRKDAKQLMVSVEPRPCPVKHSGLCRMDRVAR